MWLAIVLLVAAVGAQDSDWTPNSGLQRYPNFHLLPMDCGKRSFISPRIINGKDAQPGEFPWMAKYYPKNSNAPWCGGSIISERYILTAAHCCKIKQMDRGAYFGVGAVSTGRAVGEQIIESEDIIVHPQYVPYKHDICLVRLRKPIKFTSYVQPICLPIYEWTFQQMRGKEMETAGWGRIINGRTGPEPKRLQKTKVLIYEGCNVEGKRKEEYCALYNNTGIARGDSGGPLMLSKEGRYVIAGVVSHTYLTTHEFYAKVNNYVGWILMNMKP